MRQCADFPSGGIEADDSAGAMAFQEHAALHFDLHAAVAGFERHLADRQVELPDSRAVVDANHVRLPEDACRTRSK